MYKLTQLKPLPYEFPHGDEGQCHNSIFTDIVNSKLMSLDLI